MVEGRDERTVGDVLDCKVERVRLEDLCRVNLERTYWSRWLRQPSYLPEYSYIANQDSLLSSDKKPRRTW